ncbi:helix-turn-helix transcriptional regulator [Amycolatopsis sp. NPDC089917]|uniref:helix-turn-helix transcriptional regulator n=1 Tax=Amycolatopsis sp. NPDC089917 TaxID=3155187 RepID=UPI003414985D
MGEIEAFVSKIYSKMNIGNVAGRTRARIRRRTLSDEVVFDDADYSFDIGYAAQPPDRLIICDVTHNTIRTDNRGREDTFGPGDQFLIARPDLPYAGVGQCSRLRFTLVDPDILNRVAGSPDDAAGPVRLLDHRPVSWQAQLQLQRTITYLRDGLLSEETGPAAPLIAAAASQYLAAGVLLAYPNNAVTEATAEDRHDAHPNTVRRAVAFIEANADLGLTVPDIAHAANVTPRALQLAFRRHLDTTPLAYLRRVRLDHARDDLRTAADGRTVADIAARWGFTSTRFTQLYREAYGDLPSQTLHGRHDSD